MAHSGATPNYDLPIIEDGNRATWIGDFNEAMNKIDAAISGLSTNTTEAINAINVAILSIRSTFSLYYTKEEVDQIIAAVEQRVDEKLTDYVLKSEMPSLLSPVWAGINANTDRINANAAAHRVEVGRIEEYAPTVTGWTSLPGLTTNYVSPDDFTVMGGVTHVLRDGYYTATMTSLMNPGSATAIIGVGIRMNDLVNPNTDRVSTLQLTSRNTVAFSWQFPMVAGDTLSPSVYSSVVGSTFRSSLLRIARLSD